MRGINRGEHSPTCVSERDKSATKAPSLRKQSSIAGDTSNAGAGLR